MEESIYFYSRGDRLGSHIIQYLSIIIYAFYNNLYIVYDPQKINYNKEYTYEGKKYNKSFIVMGLLEYIDNYNKRFPIKDYEKRYENINIMEYLLDFEIKFKKFSYFYTCDLLIITTQILNTIESDLISYFKKYLHEKVTTYIEKNTPKEIIIPFNPKSTILLHLRMGDIKDRPDYDGSICSNYYKERINNNSEKIIGITNKLGYSNLQTPLSQEKILKAVNDAKHKYPNHEVVIVSEPGNYDINLPYRCIRSDNESDDLYLLCNADVLICSRSTFSLAAIFLGKAREIWCPLWGHFVCTGLYTKYDNLDKLIRVNYFY